MIPPGRFHVHPSCRSALAASVSVENVWDFYGNVCHVLYFPTSVVFVDNFYSSCTVCSLRLHVNRVSVADLVWPYDLGTTLHLPAATRCRSLCFSLVNNYSTLNSLSSYTRDFPESRHFYPVSTPCSLLWLFMCVCISSTDACSIASLRSMEPSSPADLFRTVQSYGSLYLFCRFRLCLTFRSASLSSCVVNTVQGSCSGLLGYGWIWQGA